MSREELIRKIFAIPGGMEMYIKEVWKMELTDSGWRRSGDADTPLTPPS